jgi:hypothetical protein
MGCTGGHITSPIEYVLPDGYRGEFEIVESKDGDPLPIENGAEVCHIPASGTLHIDTLESFRNYHRESARYVSGFALPIRMTDEAERAPNEVCVYTLYGEHSRIMYFVGTHSEMLARVRNPPAQTKAEELLSGGALRYRPTVTNNQQQATNNATR